MTLRGQQERRQFRHPTVVYMTNGLQYYPATSRLTSLLDCTPASDPAVCTAVKLTATSCQTHRSDVVCELDWCGESEQSNVIVASGTVIVGMQHNGGNILGHFVWVVSLQALAAQRHLPIAGGFTVGKLTTCLFFRTRWTKCHGTVDVERHLQELPT